MASTSIAEDSVIEKLFFRPHKLKPPYSFGISFSKVCLIPTRIILNDRSPTIPFATLFDVKPLEDCPDVHWVPGPYVKESTMLFDWAENLLTHFGNVTLNRSFKGFLKDAGKSPSISCEYLGIGSKSAWYGEPDARIRAGSGDYTLITLRCELSDGDGDSTLIEAKTKIQQNHLSKAVATVVVHSFTEHTHHSELNPMVPLILLNGKSFTILMYDCKKDILLISDSVDYIDDTDTVSKTGMGILWLVINHRKTLHMMNDGFSIQSGMHDFAARTPWCLLEEFKKMRFRDSRDSFYPIDNLSSETTESVALIGAVGGLPPTKIRRINN